MSRFVLDASVQLARYFHEPALPAELAGLEVSAAVVPVIWPLEILNGLLTGLWRDRISRLEVDHILAGLNQAGPHVDREPAALERVFVLAQGHGLTAYDASYLELAVRHGVPLATQDQAMRLAARRAGVPLIE